MQVTRTFASIPAVPAAMVRLPRRAGGPAGALLALLLTVPAWLPLLDPHLDLWEMDDARNHLVRLYHFNWLLERGVLYPRWAPGMAVGYGYPVFNFYAPATYYLTALLQRLLGLDVWDGYRAAAVATALLGTAGVYALAVAVWRRAAVGVVAAVAVLYAPYVFQSNLLRRGAVPEALGLALVPWLLLAVRSLWGAESPRQVVGRGVCAALAGAGVILAHNLTAVLAAGAAAAWAGHLTLRGGERQRLRRLGRVAGAGLAAAGLAATFWLPALAEGSAVQLEELTSNGGLDYRGWFVDPTGAGPRHRLPENRQTATGLIDLHLRYPHQRLSVPPKASLGQALTAALAGAGIVLALATAGRRAAERDGPTRETVRRRAGAAGALLGLAGVSWALTLAPSAPVWEHVPGMALLQFPWRMMGLFGIALGLSGAGGLALLGDALERRWAGPAGRRAAIGLASLAGLLLLANELGERSIPFRDAPRRTLDARTVLADEDADPVGMGTTSGREFLPRQVRLATYTAGQPRGKPVFERLYPSADWIGGLVHPLTGDLRIEGLRAGALHLAVRVTNVSATPAGLAVHQFAFPGWRAWVDGDPVPVGVAPPVPEQQAWPGFIVVDVPPGEHTVGLAFGPTAPRLVGAGLSLLSLLGLVSVPLGLLWTGRRALRPGLVALWLGAACAVVGAGWRSVAPAVEGVAVPDVARPGATTVATGRWGADDLARSGAGIVVNLAEAARLGVATVETPGGPALGPAGYADVRHLRVADEDAERGHAGASSRQWLYLHPPSTLSIDVDLPPRRDVRFQAGLALDPASWRARDGDGVRFLVLVTPLPRDPPAPESGGPPAGATVVLDRSLNPRAQAEHRKWLPVDADLSPWAGQRVRLSLRTDPRTDPLFDWSGWGNPVVVVFDTARGPV